MGMSVGSGGGGGGRRGRRGNKRALVSEINVTPLVDVMLVLLVIFMITAPLMTSSLKLDLPKADNSAAPSAASGAGCSRASRPCRTAMPTSASSSRSCSA